MYMYNSKNKSLYIYIYYIKDQYIYIYIYSMYCTYYMYCITCIHWHYIHIYTAPLRSGRPWNGRNIRPPRVSRCLECVPLHSWNHVAIFEILLMEEILHQLIGSLSHYFQGFIHPRWFGISSSNSITHPRICGKTISSPNPPKLQGVGSYLAAERIDFVAQGLAVFFCGENLMACNDFQTWKLGEHTTGWEKHCEDEKKSVIQAWSSQGCVISKKWNKWIHSIHFHSNISECRNARSRVIAWNGDLPVISWPWKLRDAEKFNREKFHTKTKSLDFAKKINFSTDFDRSFW